MRYRIQLVPHRRVHIRLASAFVLVLSLVSWGNFASAQIPPGDLTGEALRTWLKETFYDGHHTELGYSLARDRMYNYIDNHAL